MKESAPVYIIDDDQDDKGLILDIFKELEITHQPIFFNSGIEMITHLKSSGHTPFLILCDVNIPPMDGFNLREQLLKDENLTYRSVPFIFWSTYATENQIKKAYDLSAHGFFIKARNFSDLKKSFKNIFAYWNDSKHPNDN